MAVVINNNYTFTCKQEPLALNNWSEMSMLVNLELAVQRPNQSLPNCLTVHTSGIVHCTSVHFKWPIT